MRIIRREVCLAVCLAILVVLSGCSFLPGDDGVSTPTPEEPPANTTSPSSPTTDHNGEFSDPDSDVIGWEDGYWHDEPIHVSQDDGLTDDELDAFVARSMARVEVLRNAEFDRSVNVTVKSREEYQQDNPFETAQNSTHNDWNNQVWEALFIVDESDDVGAEFEKITGSSVLGYYVPSTDELVIVSDTPSRPTVDNSTLIHELTHALQDQRFNLSRPELQRDTQDAQLAKNGLVEGEAKLIEQRYEERCATGEWNCVDSPTTSGSSANGNLGMQMLMYQPYSDGPAYIQHLLDRGGWEAVDRAFENPPTQTAQIIHPGTETQHASFSTLPERHNGWSQFEGVGNEGADQVGEASVFMMFWHQNQHYGIDTIPRDSIRSSESGSGYSYEHSASHGLVDDRLTPYKNGDERGYVWQLQWESQSDADEFLRTYENVLRGHGGTQVAESTWVINDGGYADAFYVEQDGATIRIVNAPDRDALSELHPPAGDAEESSTKSLSPSSDTLVSIGMTGLVGLAFVLLAYKGER